MMEKSALAGDGGARPLAFILVIITYKVAVYPPAERADTLLLFHLYPYMYSVVASISESSKTVETIYTACRWYEASSALNTEIII